MKQTSLCYMEQDGAYLMLHRIKKEHDENKDKWIGIGGKFQDKESPEDCVKREVLEETGLILEDFRYCGIITFVSDQWPTEYMHLFHATRFSGKLRNCDEGVLEWIAKDQVHALPQWEGDRIFLDLMERHVPFFSLKLDYCGELLRDVQLNGGRLKTPLLISACLLGLHCRYDGRRQDPLPLEKLMERYELIPVCPEQLGGLPTPREPAERIGSRVITKGGNDVTDAYTRGAAEALYATRLYGCKTALLKKRSPSCGAGKIYDGTFSKRLIDGNGVTAALLLTNGIAVYDETQIDELLEKAET